MTHTVSFLDNIATSMEVRALSLNLARAYIVPEQPGGDWQLNHAAAPVITQRGRAIFREVSNPLGVNHLTSSTPLEGVF